jgi:hypothetical protein
MENKKQTAVEWLEDKLKENLKHIVMNGDYVLMESLFLQAKQMEKQQIIETARFYFHERGKATPEKYYNQEYVS